MEDRYLHKAKTTPKEKGEFNNVWVTGNLIVSNGKYYIHPVGNVVNVKNEIGRIIVMHEVIPDTICQCAGMPDKNSKVAYEHDIIKTPVGNAKIIWNCAPTPEDNHINVGFEVVFLDATANDNCRHDLGYWIGKSEVIGNIFDSELLQ